ncbi:class I SAM-dependent methyltransferase [Stieleria sp. JC731]|uniref:class I SAM-dependent methyltransferase n=1 Tax=Pirellulaceae TaxID=2691357 RepID=UPI001E5E6DF3|nr:class I SAM-dependent methyltransferase [Stieleria sp. JC731]MCC9600887.1 class I SAM-dependent methyltransferase [Stieleria sp. JC731]
MKDINQISQYNREAWDTLVARGDRWTIPVTSEVIAAARSGEWNIVLTPQLPVPKHWFPELSGTDVLGLASGGGQQAPILAAAGANVTVLDNSPGQLEQDQVVARRDGLTIRSVLGDMRDLSCFESNCFDLVFNPCSVAFIPNIQPVLDEAFRVLRPGGRLMCGFINAVRYLFDEDELEKGNLVITHALPYADHTHLSDEAQNKLRQNKEPFMFSHSLEDTIGGLLKAGFALTEIYEDRGDRDRLSEFCPTFFATLATKPN